jgi:hypothetical protein
MKLYDIIQYVTVWIVLSIFVGLFSIPIFGVKVALKIGSGSILFAFAVALICIVRMWIKGDRITDPKKSI